MIVVMPLAEFRADFPDDEIWDGDTVVQVGGKNVTEAIAEILAGFGCIIEELIDDEEHGWACSFSYEGLALRFRVAGLDPYVFDCEEPLRAHPKYPLYFHVLLKLNEQLRRDGRFHDLAWFEDSRPGGKAFERPVIGDIPAVDEIKRRQGFFERLLAPLRVRPAIR
jgi:hypothetical protein